MNKPMNFIMVGLGSRAAPWQQVIQKYPGAGKIGVVDPSRQAEVSGNGLCSFPTFAQAAGEFGSGVLIGSAASVASGALFEQSLAAGFHIILDSPHEADDATLRLLRQAKAQNRRAVVLLQEPAGNAISRSLPGLLKNVGEISHVSYVDRRPASDLAASAGGAPRHGQLIRFGMDHLRSLTGLFGGEPLSVIARCRASAAQSAAASVTSEVFLELDRNVHIHYYGSCGPHLREQHIRVDGRAGALWSDGGTVMWRKRGWPKFVPWRWSPRSEVAAAKRFSVAARDALQLVQGAEGGDSTARYAASQALTLLLASLRSDQESTVVRTSAA